MNNICQIIFTPEWSFLRFALLTGILLSPAIGIVGTMVVIRRISSLAGASAHAALGGFALSLFLQRVCHVSWFTPTLGAVAGALTAAMIVGLVNIYAKEREDTVIGAVWAIGMSVGLLLLDHTPGYVDWQSYLFGNMLMLDQSSLYMTLALDALVIIPTVVFFPALQAVAFDDTFARLRGIKAGILYMVILGLTALTIVLLINLVGIMLVIALLTLPGATAGCHTGHLKSMMLLSTLLCALFTSAGLLLSCFLEVPSGPAVVILSGMAYTASMLWKKHRIKQ